ncbi:SusD/RagB family nutrient-binding outer membrane lipoprotein [Hymenobacter cellulosivorans]|uniref:SusD/RagB family nutrient-binding outer membrane lipoprotein n=1 Tax=Hymenobacter cellulosivorans TaxID=2932249 RepID=A0ABY4F8L2_9BACT|nr:SusD/RagB family nutrient-binding outer membrane lipoprotein [Hymenobacter cellulosivorans]UOQ52858.1 SusD/RagB family nutrient-binding outer membrane lipoprotein [Hymenobacter cellulosivorans]
MNLRKGTALLGFLSLLATTPGCKDFFDVNVDPINATSARVEQLLPASQGAMSVYLGLSALGLSQPTSTLVNQLSSTRGIGSYTPDGDSFSNQWGGLYADCLVNTEQIIKQATASQSSDYLGIAQIQKAYVFSQMVDMWGDIPYSQALQGIANPAPKFDKDSDIYKDLFVLIDEGLQNLAKPSSSTTLPSADLIYGGDKAKWARLGRTLKLKLLNQIRLNPTPVMSATELNTQVQALLTQDLITAIGDDYEFRYNASTTPENRNLGFIADYVTASRENTIGRFFYVDVMSPSYLNGNTADPRLPYYFYNQLPKSAPAQATIDFQAGPFATVLLGSIGPNANQSVSNQITLPGLYAVGGKFDPNGFGGKADGNSGKGIVAQRFLTSASRYFTEAEVRLTILNDQAGATAAFKKGIEAAFDKVNDIASKDGSQTISTSARDAYVTSALSRGTTLSNIILEKYKAGWGFGEDIYTDYRRTGFPKITLPGGTDVRPGTSILLEPHTRLTGGYPRRLPYRQDDLTSNPNAPKQQPNVVLDKIFWDRG